MEWGTGCRFIRHTRGNFSRQQNIKTEALKYYIRLILIVSFHRNMSFYWKQYIRRAHHITKDILWPQSVCCAKISAFSP